MARNTTITSGYFKEKNRIEIQFSFSGVNDIKQNKILEAKMAFQEKGTCSSLIHIDLYNKQVAFIKLNEIEDREQSWITRINLNEGLVWNIDQNYFVCDLTQKLPEFMKLSVS